MNPFIQFAIDQYEMTKDSRDVLLEYCSTISNKNFVNENSSFGRGGSIRNLLVHIANTYEFWIDHHGLNPDTVFNATSYESISNVKEVKELFSKVDVYLEAFFNKYKDKFDVPIEILHNGLNKKVTPFKKFTHVITHEFHHKGQILSISRHLGYTPVDTDILR